MIHDDKHATARLVPTRSTPDDFSKRKAEYTYVAVYHAVAVMPSQLTSIPLIADGPGSVTRDEALLYTCTIGTKD